MADKKYHEFDPGSNADTQIFLTADPGDGTLGKIPLSDIKARFGFPGEDASGAEFRSFDVGASFGFTVFGSGTSSLGLVIDGPGGAIANVSVVQGSVQVQVANAGASQVSSMAFSPTVIQIANTGGKYAFANIAEYADNAAALSGGLTVGFIYRTGDDLKIVH